MFRLVARTRINMIRTSYQYHHSFFTSIEHVESFDQFLTILETDGVPKIASKLNDLEAAKLYAALGYALDSLFCVNVRLDGVNPLLKPDMKKELERVKMHMADIRKAEMEAQQKATKRTSQETAQEDSESNKKPKIDKKVAQRIVETTLKKAEPRKSEKVEAKKLKKQDLVV